MRALLLAVLMVVAGTVSGRADAVDDAIDQYVACLIGQSAIELNKQGQKKDPDAAQEVAYGICKEPKELASIDGDPGDYVNVAVMAIADGVWGERMAAE